MDYAAVLSLIFGLGGVFWKVMACLCECGYTRIALACGIRH